MVSEEMMDNRYLGMLTSVLEQILFVNGETRNLLLAKASVYVYPASRDATFLFESPQKTSTHKKIAHAKGYNVRTDKKTPTVAQYKTISSPEVLREILRFLSKRRRKRYELMPCSKIESINYQNSSSLSKAGYYLSYIYLGQKRYEIQKKRHKGNFAIVPEYFHTTYEQVTFSLAACSDSLNQNNAKPFLDLLQSNPKIVSHPSFAKFKMEVANRITGEMLLPILNKIKKEVDSSIPGDQFDQLRYIEANLNDLYEANLMLRDQHGRLALDWIHLAVANHFGDLKEGDRVLKEYESHKEDYKIMSQEKAMEIHTEMVFRRVVNLVDTFRYDEARILTENILEKQENLQKQYLNNSFLNVPHDRPLLGHSYSSLGQIKAFTAEAEDEYLNAIHLFKKSLDFYNPENDPCHDRDRTWIYIGHVVCDLQWRGFSSAATLWNEVCEHLPLSLHDEDKWIFLNNNIENRYLLSLQMKAVLLFDDTQDVITFLTMWNRSQNLVAKEMNQAVTNHEKTMHPFGIMFQTLALLCERQFRENPTEKNFKTTVDYYDKAINILHKGNTNLFELLSQFAKIRQCLFSLETQNDTDTYIQQQLIDTYEFVKILLYLDFGESAWAEQSNGKSTGFFGAKTEDATTPEKKALAIINAVHFNYW